MDKCPLISIIVPAYNAEKWIDQTCNSVFEQTYKNWELIVVDDGSCDNTYEILKNITQNLANTKIIRTENGGVCRARNIGIDAANGEYITFLDADDLLTADALESLYKAIEKYDVDIVAARRINIDSSGRELTSPYPEVTGIWKGTQALEFSLKDHPSSYTVWGKLYKKSAIDGIYFIDGKRVNEDSFFVFQCFLKKPTVALIGDIVLKYRLTESSASRAPFSEKFFDILYFAKQKKRLIDEMYPEFSKLAENVLIKAHLSFLKNLCKTKDKKYRVYEKASIKEIKKRKKNFVPAIKGERLMFWIVTHNLYSLYKNVYYPLRKRYFRF